MDQRVGLLMERLDVLGDLLAVLKDQVRTSHGEYLEWIGMASLSHHSCDSITVQHKTPWLENLQELTSIFPYQSSSLSPPKSSSRLSISS